MSRRAAPFVALTAVLAALFWIDVLFVPLVLLGPIVTGVVAGPRGAARPAAAAWFAAGLLTLVIDWVVNNEDQIFHLAMAAWTAGVTLGVGAAVASIRARTLRRRALRNGIPRVHRQTAGS